MRRRAKSSSYMVQSQQIMPPKQQNMQITEKCGSKYQNNQLRFLNDGHWGQEIVVLENYLILETVCMCNFDKHYKFQKQEEN